jgi:hypothetical protein
VFVISIIALIVFDWACRNAGYAAATGMALGWPTVPLEQLSGVFSNYVFKVGFVAWFIAQGGKVSTVQVLPHLSNLPIRRN